MHAIGSAKSKFSQDIIRGIPELSDEYIRLKSNSTSLCTSYKRTEVLSQMQTSYTYIHWHTPGRQRLSGRVIVWCLIL